MKSPLHERLQALREFMSPPSANAADLPTLELLDEAVQALTPPTLGKPAPTAVEMPWPNLPAGSRLVTSAYPRSVVADYGNARAIERDTFWRGELIRARLDHSATQQAFAKDRAARAQAEPVADARKFVYDEHIRPPHSGDDESFPGLSWYDFGSSRMHPCVINARGRTALRDGDWIVRIGTQYHAFTPEVYTLLAAARAQGAGDAVAFRVVASELAAAQDELTRLHAIPQAAEVPAKHCSVCGDTGIVTTGFMTHSEGGVEYSVPIRCVDDCPACSLAAAPTQTASAPKAEGALQVSVRRLTFMREAPNRITAHLEHEGDIPDDRLADVFRLMLGMHVPTARAQAEVGAPKAEGEGEAEAAQSWNVLKLLGRYDQAQSNLAQALRDGINVHGEIARVTALREELEAALARPMFATQPPSSADRPREGGDVVAAAREVVRTWNEDVPMSDTASAVRNLEKALGTTTSEGAKRSFSYKPQPAVAVEARDLAPVIAWLEGGCDPKQAAQELRLLAARSAPAVAEKVPLTEPVAVTVEEMVESVNGVSWWVVLRRGKHRQDDGKYGADYKNRAEWHAAGLRWILGQGEKPNIRDFMDAPPTVGSGSAQEGQAK